MKNLFLFILLFSNILLINSCCVFYDENPGRARVSFSIINKNGEDIFKDNFNIDSLKITKLDTLNNSIFLDTSVINDDSVYINKFIFFYRQNTIGKTYIDNYLIHYAKNDFDTLQLVYSMYESECNSPYPGEIVAFYQNNVYISRHSINYDFEFIKN